MSLQFIFNPCKVYLKKSILWGFLFLTIGLKSCINISFVNNYASSSLKSIQKYEEIDYNFKQNCLDKCRDNNIRHLLLQSHDCDCQDDEKADSVTQIIYTALNGYFEGLTNLSNNDLTCYKMNSMSKALTEGEFGSLKIDKEQAEAFSNISKILVKAITDEYRKRKLKEFVRAGNSSVQVLIQCLIMNLSSSLSGKLEIQKQRYESFYFDLVRDTSLSTYEKQKAVMDYFTLHNGIALKQQSLYTYTRTLKKIAEGHQVLNDSLDKKNMKEVRSQLLQYASDIRDLISEFNKIKK
jgi:hypothetical protein